MTLDIAGFERAVVRHCSPTLAGMKPGCLFNVPGTFAADDEGKPTEKLASWRVAHGRRERLAELVGQERTRLSSGGVTLRVAAWHRCGALVYVYRPDQLAQMLGAPPVAERLGEWGYHVGGAGWLDAALTQLYGRLARCHQGEASSPFPHEIGFFLGYPYGDVMGFIEHGEAGCLCHGVWKVYAERDRAEACFERYRHCTQVYEALFETGVSIGDLALAHTTPAQSARIQGAA